MMYTPKVSVIIPVYNQEVLVLKALDSIPTRDDIEIIVIDDGFTDDTWTKIWNYTMEHPKKNIVALYNQTNCGVSVTVNKGYDAATGEYVVVLGSDDYFYTSEFKKGMEELDGTDLVYFNLVRNDNSILDLSPETKLQYCGSTKFIKRSILGDCRCPVGVQFGEDYDLYKQILAKNPSEKYTHLNIKHYNYPRVGSLCWQKEQELIAKAKK